MRERVQHLVGEEAASGMWMGTFHSIFARMMRAEIEALGFSRDFSIYDTDDTERVIRNLMHGLNIDTKQFNPRAIRSMISGSPSGSSGLAAAIAWIAATIFSGSLTTAG